MADRHWVGGTATWDGTAGTKWALTNGGAGGEAVPTAADDVFFDSGSGTVTVTTSGTTTDNARSINFTGFTGTFNHAASTTVRIGDGTTGHFTLDSGMTAYTVGSATTSLLSFISTTTGNQITTAGKTMPSTTFNGAGGGWTLQDGMTTASTSTVTVTAGTFDTNGQTCSWGLFAFPNSATRNLTLGASQITMTGTGDTVWNAGASGGSFTANTSTITFTGSSAGFYGGNRSYNVVEFTGSSLALIRNSNTFATLTRTGTTSAFDGFGFAATTTQTITTLNINGNSTTNRMLVYSITFGSTATLAVSSTISASYADFRDITGSGAASRDLSAITGNSGDCGGNVSFTFTTGATQTATGSPGTSQNWSDLTWSGRIPLPQDDATVNVNLSNAGGVKITLNMPRLGKDCDFSGLTLGASTRLEFVHGSAIGVSFYGSVVMKSGLIGTFTNTQVVFAGRGAHTITSNGFGWMVSSSQNTGILAVGGSYTLLDAFSVTGTGALVLTFGTLDGSSFNVTAASFSSSNSNTRAISGSGTWTVSGTGTAWNIGTSTGMTTTGMSTATISMSDVSGTAKTFAGGGKAYGNLTILSDGSAGTTTITGANTFSGMTIGAGGAKSIVLPGSTTTTFSTASSGLGNGTNVITFTASAGSATIACASGTFSWDYVNLTNIPASGATPFYAGTHSTDGGGNTNWNFTDPPGGGTPVAPQRRRIFRRG